jgi:protein gp37
MERITDMSIKIDEDFKNQIPPLTAEELAGLEAGLVEAGRAINPIVVWPQRPEGAGSIRGCVSGDERSDGCHRCSSGDIVWLNSEETSSSLARDLGGYPSDHDDGRGSWFCEDCEFISCDYEELIVDGHNRYEICTRLGLPFETVQMNFADRQAAEDWIDRNQLHRRNLNPNGASLLRGRIYNRTKKQGQRTDTTSPQIEEKSTTATKLATDYGVSRATIERDGQFARAVETVKQADPEIEKKVHQGQVNKQSVVAAAEVVSNPEKAVNPETARRAAEVIPPERVPLPVANPEAKPVEADPTKSDSITLDAWEKLTPEQRKKVFARTGGSGFNAQDNDSIEWALWSWNPITGCQHNCPYCYARDIAERYGGTAFPDGFKPALRPGRLAAPQHQKFPEEKAKEWMGHKNVFTGSMADIFGKWVPAEWIEAVLDSIRKSPQWNFLMLTKFPARMSEFDLPDNVWAGTSVDCQARVANAEKAFAKVKAKVKWLSIEPMIEPLKFKNLEVFNWIVIGGASRSNQTPDWSPPREWVDDLEAECKKLGIPYYEKSNLFKHSPRRRGYPGQPVYSTPDIVAPEALRYLPPKEQFVG